MKHVNMFFAVLLLTLVAFFPAGARADDRNDDLDDLDVFMIVLDDASALDKSIAQMDGPDDGDVGDGDWEDSEGDDNDSASDDEQSEDESDEGRMDDEDEMEDEDDFEDGEDVDDDEPEDDEDDEDDNA